MSGRSASALSGRRSGTVSYPLMPPTPDSSKKLTESLSTLSLANSLHSASPLIASAPLNRRQSMDFRHGRSPTPSSPGSDNPRRITRAPSTPNIRKRASIASLCSSPVPGSGPHVSGRTSLSRRSSVLSLRSPSTEPVQLQMPFPFRREGLPVQDLTAPTTVVFHDTSYKHRYLRPNTGKADIATIVERPERIAAATLGVTAAQTFIGKSKLSIRKSVRVGGLLDAEVMLVHSHGSAKGGKTWPEELAAMCGLAAEKLRKGDCEVPKNLHQSDLYLCGESREDLEGCLGAIYDGVDIVFGGANETQGHEMDEEDQSGVTRAFVCIRPPGHHCAEAQPSGFCWLNNVHIAIAHAARQHGLTHAVILDFDLHHGDGSQSIAWTLNELANSPNTSLKKTAGIHVPQIGYFSLHDINSYPCEYGDTEKIKNASLNIESHGQFIQNMHLKPYRRTDDFWELYENRYSGIIAKAREFLSVASVSKPKKNGREFKAGLFLSAGFDASEHESDGMQRHQVNVPTGFFARFTSDAVALAEQYCGGRVLSVLEGGYSDRALITGVFAHLAGLACPSPTTVSGYVPPSNGLMPVPEPYSTRPTSADRGWDPEWWGMDRISELERYSDKMTAKRPSADKSNTSYLSATAASSARAEIPRRVTSNGGFTTGPVPVITIPWEVQAWELSRRIIPDYEESVEIPPLDKPTLPAKNKRHSVAVVPDAAARMTLRDRRPKAIPDPTPTLNVRKRRTTTGAMSSTAPSQAPSRVNTPMPLSRDSTPAPGTSAGSRRITSSGGGVSVAGPRTLGKKPSIIGNSATTGQKAPGLQRKPSVNRGTRPAISPSAKAISPGLSPETAVSPSTTASSRSSSNGSTTAPSTSTGLSGKDLDEAFMSKFQKVRITYKNREREEELLRMERQKEELERKLDAEKRRLSITGSNGVPANGSRRTSRIGSSSRSSSVRRTSVSLATVNGVGIVSQVNGHAEKETKMVNTPPPSMGAGGDHTYRGGEIKFGPDSKVGSGPRMG